MSFGVNARFLAEAKQCEPYWEKTGLLEGLSDPYVRATTAVLLENQRLSNQQSGMLNETSTDSGDIANFKRISIPLVRRIYAQLIANKIVSVQPLLGPTGLVYYLRFRYSTDKGAMRGGSLQGGYPSDDAASMQQRASGDGNVNEYYSSQFVQNETSDTHPGGAALTYTYSPLEHTPVFAGTLIGTIYDDSTAIQTFTVDSDGDFTFTSIGSPSQVATDGTVDLATGEVTLTFDGDPGSHYVVFSYEYNMECNSDLPEINLALENEEIVAKTRKLKAVWSFEAQQDLRSQHSLDAENELTAVLAQEINIEIDREILSDLRNNAGTVAVWDFNTALGDTIKERYESLYVKVVEISNVIARKTLRGGANWIVCSPEVASIFETATAGFAPDGSEGFTGALGVQYVGTVMKRWKLYKDPLAPSSSLLMGYKGDSYMDSGYFYCPYVPLTSTPVIYDPDSLCPRRGVMVRYGKKLLREGSKFYGRISIANFAV